MKNILIKLIVIVLIALAVSMLGTTFVKANYQSKTGIDRKTENIWTWRKNIRYMEKYGGVMGLNETIDDDTLVSQNPNSIDVHMMKNTEYGAMAILAVSTEYGKQPRADDTDRLKTSRYVIGGNAGLRTTTGNVYGIYIDTTSQYTSAFGTSDGTYNSLTAGRYYDVYKVGNGSQITYKDGDALEETRNWQTTYSESWGRSIYYTDRYWLYRISDINYGYYGGIMYGSYGDNGYSRACIVNGDQI